MKVFALCYRPEKDEAECIIGLYESEENLREDIEILKSIDELASRLNNKDLHPQQNGDFGHYSWHEEEIVPRKEKKEKQ